MFKLNFFILDLCEEELIIKKFIFKEKYNEIETFIESRDFLNILQEITYITGLLHQSKKYRNVRHSEHLITKKRYVEEIEKHFRISYLELKKYVQLKPYTKLREAIISNIKE